MIGGSCADEGIQELLDGGRGRMTLDEIGQFAQALGHVVGVMAFEMGLVVIEYGL